MQEKKVTIIIPLPKFNDYIREAIPYYEKLDYKNFEILILPDGEETEELSKTLPIRVIPSGKVGPAEKRDLGAKHASGEILAFTDDDAFPSPEWIRSAMEYFGEEKVGAVGGPAVTPDSDSFWQRISGNVYASPFMSGGYRRRYIAGRRVMEDYDLPSVNLIVRKDIFERIGGFDSTFYPGEDTKLCLEIKKLGYKILYNPKSLVYHHRRKLFWVHFSQISNYALHRGFFAKRYPETSRKPAYFVASLFLLGVVFGWIPGLFFFPLEVFYFGVLGLYGALNLVFSFKPNPAEWFWTFAGVFLSHLTYGLYFIKGLMTKELQR